MYSKYPTSYSTNTAVMRERFRPVLHQLNTISLVRSSVQLSHGLYKLKPITSTSGMNDAWNAEQTLQLIEIVIKTTVLWQMYQKNTEGRNRGTPRTLLCIGCTSVVQCEQTTILQSAEMRNFWLRNAEKR